MPTRNINSLFFDLDGTLLDTAPDLAAALNQVLTHHDRPTLPLKVIRPAVAEGTRGILKQGFPIDENDEQFDLLKEEFLETYEQIMTRETKFFDGMEQVLDYLDDNALPWGIVTNKPGWLAKPLLSHFNLDNRYTCLVAGDTLAKRKPDPEPLYHACYLTGTDPEHSLYVGDALGDVRAAKTAGMYIIVATYGYLRPDYQPHLWQADGLIDSPLEIIDWLNQ
ncbi:phosphoglycolate phosphatase [Candidiatus Paracoxiella cheracis]|uniref:phosphoglycolate phosphatase n=1 Tax=Candidiatus Paracoxiella cheracis TaxID=3405120 RepID=UPI003BF52F30